MDSKVFICFILVKDRYGLVSKGNVLISKKYSKGKRIALYATWITYEDTFIDAKSDTGL